MYGTFGIYMNGLCDIMLNEMVLNCGRAVKKKFYSLEGMSSRYLGYKFNNPKQGSLFPEDNFSKDTRLEFINLKDEPFNNSHVEYGANDVILPLMILEKQKVKLKEDELEKCADFENKFLPALGYIETCGFYINQQKWLDNIAKHEDKVIETIDILDEYVAKKYPKFKGINWASSKQVSVLFKKAGYDLSVVDERKSTEMNTVYRDSVEKKVIEKYAESKLISKYIEYKKAAKLCSTYGAKFLEFVNPTTNRMHSSYWQIVDTGRLSSSKVNMQNIPRDPMFREPFQAEPGNMIVKADYSQQEVRMFASYCNDKNLKSVFEGSNSDIHATFAAKLFKKDIKDVTYELRQLGKIANFTLIYGGGAGKLSQTMGIPLEEAKQIVNSYFSSFPDARKYFAKTYALALQRGYIQIDNVIGRKTYISKFHEYDQLNKILADSYNVNLVGTEKVKRTVGTIASIIKRMSYNYPVQGGSASMTKLALIYMYE